MGKVLQKITKEPDESILRRINELKVLKQSLIADEKDTFRECVSKMDNYFCGKGLSEILILAVKHDQKWAVEELLKNVHCCASYNNSQSIQEASINQNLELVALLYPLCNPTIALHDLKWLGNEQYYETLEQYDLNQRLDTEIRKQGNYLQSMPPRKI